MHTHAGGKRQSQGINLCFRNGDGLPFDAYQVHDRGDLQDLRPVSPFQLCEDITGKQRQLKLLATVFPAAHRLIQRQKAWNVALTDLAGDAFFMAGTGVERVPVRSAALCTGNLGGRHHRRQRHVYCVRCLQLRHLTYKAM